MQQKNVNVVNKKSMSSPKVSVRDDSLFLRQVSPGLYFYSFPLGGGRWAAARMRGALLDNRYFLFYTPHLPSGHPLPQGARETERMPVRQAP